MGKEIIFCRLFKFGGSNSHLNALIKYLGEDKVILALEDESQLAFLPKITGGTNIQTIVVKGMKPFAQLAAASPLSNLRETLLLLKAIGRLIFLCIKHRVTSVTVNTVEPEKFLYFLWTPLIKLRYIIHSTPEPRFSPFTTFTCNHTLGRRKLIITVSAANKKAICESWQIPPRREALIRVVYNCAMAEPGPGLMDRTAGDHGLNIITMGHLAPYKNPELWLKVAENITGRFPNVRFFWLGEGPLMNELRVKIAGNISIVLKGVVDDPLPYLENAGIYYQPSLHETHGIAVLEAMRFHLPCVASATGGLPESVEDACSGILVEPDNVQQHVDALQALITDPSLRKRYGDKGYERYQSLFSFQQFSDELDKIYPN